MWDLVKNIGLFIPLFVLTLVDGNTCPMSGTPVPSRYSITTTASTLYYHADCSGSNVLTFYGAKMNCRTDGGYLASPVNSAQLDKVLAIRDTLPGDAWIGLENPTHVTCDNEFCNKQLLWDVGSRFAWKAYTGTLPDVDMNWYYAVGLRSDHELETSDGGNRKCYICQFDCDNIFTPNYTCPNNPSLTAPEGYHRHGGKFYKFYDPIASFDEAQAACNAEGASLATFREEGEYLALKNLMNAIFEQSWIGLISPGITSPCTTPAECSKKLLWIDNGEPFVDPSPSWTIDEGLVSDYSDNVCHVLKNDLLVEEKDCTLQHTAICQYGCSSPETTSLTCPSGSSVPSGYFYLLGNYYRKSSSTADHDNAKFNCNNLDGFLATASNETEYKALLSLSGIHRNDIHIGLENPNGTVCTSTSLCNDLLYWRQADGVLEAFDGSYIYNGINADGGSGSPCFFIDQGSGYEIRDESCTGSNKDYFCQFRCPTSCPSPTVIDNAIANGTASEQQHGVKIR